MNFSVSRLDWFDWYEALTAASPHLASVDVLATLLEKATIETRCPDDPSYDMPWYERENYIAQAVITAGWAAPSRQPAQERIPPAGEQPYFRSQSGNVEYPVSQLDWSGWYATVTSVNPQLDDLHLLGELIHATSYVAQKAGMPEPEQHRYLARAIVTAGWMPSSQRRR
ncbi:hypothetical protein ACFVTM_18715 [Arthrobacter sp. NPDC058130]|uniref:hypothetical protein n=1 Tax=Arthrobacter sp. NPDC058130 TaxID=3346353 RepID=UPI0036E78DEF